MIRVGIIDCDTSHVEQFTRRLHHVDIPEDQWVDGARVVAAYPGTSRVFPQEQIDAYTASLRGMGVEIVSDPSAMLGRIDAVLVESQAGNRHLAAVRPFLEKGLPCFVDKPFASSTSDAREMVRLSEKHGAPLFSSSSLRYAPEVVQLQQAAQGPVVGAVVHSPATLHPENPGLFHYGIHGVEMLYTLMGPGCREVRCVFTEDVEVNIGLWRDGRVGVMRGSRGRGGHGYGYTAWLEKGIRQATIDTAYIYRELLKHIVAFFQTGKPPLDIRETCEIVAFQEAALLSIQQHGASITLP